MSKWGKCKLGDYIDVLHGYPCKGEYMTLEADNDLPIVTTMGNFLYAGGFDFVTSKVKRYTSDYPEEFKLSSGDMLVGMTCQTSDAQVLGIPGYIPDDGRTYIHNQRLGKIVFENDGLSPDFLYYLFLTGRFRTYMANTASGSKVKHTSPGKIKDYTFRKPPISEQKKIGSILRSIDDKIEVNRKLNDNLEAMAQALYDYWFVQFDFPDANGKPYKSSGGKMVWNEVLRREIPEGWTNSTVQDYIKIGNGKDHKSVGSGEIPCYGSGGFMFGVAKAIYTGESVLLPRKGSLNNVMLVDGSFWTVDTMFYSEPKMKGAAKYVYYGIQVYDLASMNLGTGVPSMTSTRLYSLKLVGAPYTILEKFDAVVSPLLSKARRLLAENKVLAAQRDFLLPLLMNGQVQVKPQGVLNYHLSDD